MNYADSARIKAVLINCGFSYSETIQDANIIIFDTCSIKQKAEDKITWKLKEIPKNKKIRITGCMVQHNLRNSKISKNTRGKSIPGLMKKGNFLWNTETQNPNILWLDNKIFKTLSKLKPNKINLYLNHAFNPLFVNLQKKHKNLELMLRIDDIWFLPVILPKLNYKINKDPEIINEYTKIIPDFKQNKTSIDSVKNSTTITAYIPISTGCNQFCSFCIVPYARGLEKYFSVEQIVEEAKIHLKEWTKEIYLLGQIVNKHPKFIEIVKEILKIPELKRLRYTSPYPTYYSKELFDLHETEEKLCPHIHIPVQSWSNTILKKMFRGYTVEEYRNFIDEIHKLKRKISITTDIIVWFPNETDEDFQQTLNLVKYSKFDMIFIWIYSSRPWTYAHQKMKDNIPYKTKHQRRTQLNDILTKISNKNNQAELWTTKEILIDSIIKTQNWYNIEWHTDNMKTVRIETKTINPELKINTLINTEIIAVKSLKLFWSNKFLK